MNPQELDRLAIQVDKEQIRRKGLVEFVKRAWHLVEPAAPYTYCWIHDEIATHIAACLANFTLLDESGSIVLDARRLIINVPPGTSKSLFVSVFLLPWIWTFWPGFRIIYGSYDKALVERDARKALKIIRSKWYQDRWPEVKLESTSPAESRFMNTMGGFRYATSVGSAVTGWHAHLKVVDDPTKPLDAIQTSAKTDPVALIEVQEWWKGTMSTRNVDPANPRYCIIMQRLHEDDLAGYLQREDIHPCPPTVLKLPMRFVERDRCWNKGIGGDRRVDDGQLLWPARFPEDEVKRLERSLGAYAPAQLQQDPVNPEGEIFKASTFQRYKVRPNFNWYTLSIDCTFKDTAGADNVSAQIWGQLGPNHYWVWEFLDKLSFTGTVDLIKQLKKTWKIGPILIEDKANGTAVMNVLKDEVPGLIAVTPDGGKIARAHAVTYLYSAGNVWYPEEVDEPLVVRHTNQLLGFPKKKNDDSVDACTQYLNWAGQNGCGVLEAMAARRALYGS